MPVLGDHPGMECLSQETCLELMAGARLGRLGLTTGALPLVLPVNFAVSELGIVIRTRPGSKLDAAAANQVVCFEVDGADCLGHAGWSVVVTGVARVLDGDELARARKLAVPHWVDDDANQYLAIPLERVSGRRLRHTGREPARA